LDNLANFSNDFTKFLAGAAKKPEGDLAYGLQMQMNKSRSPVLNNGKGISGSILKKRKERLGRKLIM
jgi:hypothetical protein